MKDITDIRNILNQDITNKVRNKLNQDTKRYATYRYSSKISHTQKYITYLFKITQHTHNILIHYVTTNAQHNYSVYYNLRSILNQAITIATNYVSLCPLLPLFKTSLKQRRKVLLTQIVGGIV